MKKLWFDTETTGTDPLKHDIIQIAGLIEINGEVVDEFNIRCAPKTPKDVSEEALAIVGVTLKEILGWQNAVLGLNELLAVFNKHIDKFDKNDKFIPCGHNVSFDLQMLQSFFHKNGEKYGCGSYQNWQAIDTLHFARIANDIDPIGVPDFKLKTLADFFDIEINAHNALSDIKASRALYQKLKDYVGFSLHIEKWYPKCEEDLQAAA